jgi:hypothetical protein
MSRRASSLNSPQHTAIHEAGRAVIGRVLTLSCGSATITPEFAKHTGEVDSAGHAVTDDPHECSHQWEKRGKVRSENAVWHARIITYMAGAEAEVQILDSTQGGDGDDMYQINLMAEELIGDPLPWKTREARLRSLMRMLVRRHRERIECVAGALLTKKILSAKAID